MLLAEDDMYIQRLAVRWMVRVQLPPGTGNKNVIAHVSRIMRLSIHTYMP